MESSIYWRAFKLFFVVITPCLTLHVVRIQATNHVQPSFQLKHIKSKVSVEMKSNKEHPKVEHEELEIVTADLSLQPDAASLLRQEREQHRPTRSATDLVPPTYLMKPILLS